mmetsp:Transcript_34681/g.68001  ORF Transcript_34681/g.68001 Transcript_34681/m.68001 type:complete len:187 (+) Transcript_34681:226-786(+)|eukprot:CAMPEP_0173382806 /NCGR_PEP_ID=MMETSP1356-20130122/5339_1 /TAXON_ID=77927 ORGANISM="Hemiselmis virescens, Strain PCC157" /NCGR_SAMPLE_ID=MMETSP1356 /ASSEMBLY_ACC=CAM_ASM_000847 /LENGTH=186 /DNA_ID=CAMNT_0014337359 /DNA_START=209 /DNA_END=769 /DNA_ORIENTATION=-
MDGLRVMPADVENQHMVQQRAPGKSLGLGGSSGGGASASKQMQGATPMRRKALGDITNSRSASKQNSSQKDGGGSSQKGAKAMMRASAHPPAKLVFASHVEEVDTASRMAGEEAFSDPALDIDALLSAAGPAEPLSAPIAELSHRPVAFEQEPAAGDEEEELVDMEFDDECPFDAAGDDLAVDFDD